MANNQNSQLDKARLNVKQIAKYANSKKLVDAVDNIDSLHSVKGTYNKKVVLTVNEFGISGHKEKYASFFWDLDEALVISNDIINNRFETEVYAGSTPALYNKYGGGAVSRILTISYKEGKYIIQVALYEAIKGANGQIQPDKNKPIDKHNIQMNKYDARKFFMAIYATILSKMGNLTTLPGQAVQTPAPTPKVENKPVSEPINTDVVDPFAVLSDGEIEW